MMMSVYHILLIKCMKMFDGTLHFYLIDVALQDLHHHNSFNINFKPNYGLKHYNLKSVLFSSCVTDY